MLSRTSHLLGRGIRLRTALVWRWERFAGSFINRAVLCHDAGMWTTRPYQPGDQDAVMELADRLTVGAPSWREADLWLAAVRGWVKASIEAVADDGRALVVAVDDEQRVGGFVSLGTKQHFTGVVDAYISELVVASWAEGRGAGRALLGAAEQWAVAHGRDRLTLETGVANQRARRFYDQADYRAEDVRLTKVL